jgi:hypothetical protein
MNQRLDRIRILRALARPLVTVQSSCFDLILNGRLHRIFTATRAGPGSAMRG